MWYINHLDLTITITIVIAIQHSLLLFLLYDLFSFNIEQRKQLLNVDILVFDLGDRACFWRGFFDDFLFD